MPDEPETTRFVFNEKGSFSKIFETLLLTVNVAKAGKEKIKRNKIITKRLPQIIFLREQVLESLSI